MVSLSITMKIKWVLLNDFGVRLTSDVLVITPFRTWRLAKSRLTGKLELR